ncbi:farnesyl diphosphate synthase [Dictyostelium purpureum]|uniref:(2E,6E)-farnesyl diphosphate synthase n=1 Tax=Dictyostelium purpureum TaxID=5786 RepID=F0Z8Y9_DICPU|nr:farnesyl diphosphate synthase [Dictyostelium purpureum]EGC39544.1 farnesyl diphosphate synthase [Dictyostelium purpureum]|eukprot:XP_003283879.1 farnesyl diphosphate synthase [Dictyostelium purpureum]
MNNQSLQRVAMISEHLNPSSSELNMNNTAASVKTPKEELKDFIDIFPILSNEIIRELPGMDMPPQTVKWVEKLLETNVMGGKMNRGLTVLHSLQLLVEGRQLTRSEIFQANVLGWCVEWLQSFFLVADDLMDSSITRRGQPCWYRQPNPISNNGTPIGTIAVNDSFILESCIYILIKKYFRNEQYYADILDLFHETSYQTELGQLLDLTTQPNRGDFSLFTLNTYRRIVKYKTAYYSFYLPVALAMLMCGINSTPAFETAKDILLPMGEYFQIQDDYLDCYGSPAVIGKIGRDIEENKCSWMICQAILNATPSQIETLKKHYGVDNPEDVQIVKKLFGEIDLKKIFKTYEEESYGLLVNKIKQVRIMPQEVFLKLLSKIYKRDL